LALLLLLLLALQAGWLKVLLLGSLLLLGLG
jgi:hypothetical protein